MLIRIPNWLGDALMATPVYENLSYALKDGEELLLFGPKAFINLFEDFPRVKLLPFDKEDPKKNLEILRPYREETGILLTNSFSSAWLFFRARIKERMGYNTDLRGLLLTKKVKPPKEKMHQRDRYLYLITAFGYEVKTRELIFYYREEKLDRVYRFLKEVGLNPERPFLVFATGAAYGPAKKWPLEYFRKLSELLTKEGFEVCLVGSEREREEGEWVASNLKGIYNLCGKTDITLLPYIFLLSKALVSNDSGLMHLGAALKIPQIAIFGSTDPEVTGPLNPYAIVLKSDLPCSPCFERTCPKGNYQCLKEISVERVWKELQKIL